MAGRINSWKTKTPDPKPAEPKPAPEPEKPPAKTVSLSPCLHLSDYLSIYSFYLSIYPSASVIVVLISINNIIVFIKILNTFFLDFHFKFSLSFRNVLFYYYLF